MSKQQCASVKRPLSAFLGGLLRIIHETVIDPMRDRARRRAEVRELARLDDRLLRDIGLRRAQVLAAAFGPVGPDGHSFADSVRTRPSRADNVVHLKREAHAERVEESAAAPLARRAARG